MDKFARFVHHQSCCFQPLCSYRYADGVVTHNFELATNFSSITEIFFWREHLDQWTLVSHLDGLQQLSLAAWWAYLDFHPSQQIYSSGYQGLLASSLHSILRSRHRPSSYTTHPYSHKQVSSHPSACSRCPSLRRSPPSPVDPS